MLAHKPQQPPQPMKLRKQVTPPKQMTPVQRLANNLYTIDNEQGEVALDFLGFIDVLLNQRHVFHHPIIH